MEKRIGFGRRLGAYLIDIVFLLGLSFIFVNIAADFLYGFVDESKITEETYEQMQAMYGNFTDTMLLLGPAAIFIGFIYNLLEGFKGYTLGKLILGIQVGNPNGTPAEINKFMARFAIKNISTIIGLIGTITFISAISTVGSVLGFIILIGCFFVLGEKKQAFHDMIAKTAVYRKAELEDGTAQDTVVTYED